MLFGYNKSTRSAIAAMSRLAEVYDGGTTRLSAADLAKSRNLQKPFVAKILTALSQANLVAGLPGPGGGYALARPPESISFYDVARLFERENEDGVCPFGPGHCGHKHPCAIHDRVAQVDQTIKTFLEETNFEVFQGVKA